MFDDYKALEKNKQAHLILDKALCTVGVQNCNLEWKLNVKSHKYKNTLDDRNHLTSLFTHYLRAQCPETVRFLSRTANIKAHPFS